MRLLFCLILRFRLLNRTKDRVKEIRNQREKSSNERASSSRPSRTVDDSLSSRREERQRERERRERREKREAEERTRKRAERRKTRA